MSKRSLNSVSGLDVVRNGSHAWTVRLKEDRTVVCGGRTRAAAVRTANIILNRQEAQA